MVTIPRKIIFKPTRIENYGSSSGRCMQSQDYIRFDGDFNGTRRVVSSITISSQNLSAYLNTDINPSTPYVPQYPGSPTTKQYVDQHDTIVSATAPSNPTEGMVWYDSTNDVLKTYDGTNWSEAGTKMVVLEYGVSTWQDFLDAYNKNAIVYCKVSSGSSGYRMAFMAYTAGQGTPTEVEFQYYRSRSSHSTAQNQLDEVYVYKLTNAGVWTTTQRDTAAKAIAGTGIGLTFNSSGMTISADTSVLATKTDLNSKQDTLVSGTNIKTINSNSLLGSGDIALNDVKVSSTAPASPTEGMVWYDTTNDVLKVYDGTNWNVTGKEYHAGEGIEIGTVQDYSAMRGPCPEGFHIPTNNELQNIINIGNALSAWSTPAQCESILNLTNHNKINWQGGYILGLNGAFIWSCTPNNSGQSYAFSTAANKIQIRSSENRNNGYQIRPFKDKPVIPDNTRTTLFDGSSIAAGAGIFSNSLLGLISLSSDGENRTTIAIKNLGAPDTTSAGYYYQRGNNNGFVANGYTTSETTVDASNYGPLNYYNSNVFIMGNNGVWDSSNNRNLRGGLTGVVTLDNAITNTGVLSVNGQTGAVTVNEGNVKVFEVPAVNDDISDMVTRISAGKGVILHEMVSGTDAFYKVDYHDDVNCEITASLIYSYNGGYARVYTIEYNYSTKRVSTKTPSLIYFFAPETAGTQGQVLKKTNSGYEWAAPQGTTYNAGEGIEIGTIQDYSAMQGPAPDGFHVPLNTEWQAVYDIWTALGGGSSDGTNFGIALKLPFAGYRFSSSAGVGSQGSYGFYWSSSRNNTNNAYLLNFNSSDVLPQNANYRAFGYSVRCFKNSPTVPTSSWTKLYGTSIEAGGIFWSSTEGLISMSSDGQTWITIQDKNLGATTVWNSGDTLSEANCGKYYQRGNNYGFPRTGSVTTSSTQVDASTYGPGNYYSSSTFITRNSSPYRWDTTDNGNLWGGVTGVVTYDNAITNTGVLSVNGQTGNITIETFQLAPNSPLTPKYRRYGTQAQYEALTQYYTDEVGDTVYFTI